MGYLVINHVLLVPEHLLISLSLFFEHGVHFGHGHDLVLDDPLSLVLDVVQAVSLSVGLVRLSELSILVFQVLGQFVVSMVHDDVHQHFMDLISEEGQGPLKDILVVGQVERVWYTFVLLDVHLSFIYQDDGSFVFVVAIVRCRKNSDQGWESFFAAPSVHFVAINLNLVSTNDRQIIICF